jgi:hypothetical protein
MIVRYQNEINIMPPKIPPAGLLTTLFDRDDDDFVPVAENAGIPLPTLEPAR